MKTLCIIIVAALLNGPTHLSVKASDKKQPTTDEILKSWNYREKKVDVEISELKVGMAEIKYKQNVGF